MKGRIHLEHGGMAVAFFRQYCFLSLSPIKIAKSLRALG